MDHLSRALHLLRRQSIAQAVGPGLNWKHCGSALAGRGHENRRHDMLNFLAFAFRATRFPFFVLIDRHVELEIMSTLFAFVLVSWHMVSTAI